MDLQNLINNISVHKSFDYLLGKFEESYKSNGGSICFWLPAELYSVTKNPEYLEKMREEVWQIKTRTAFLQMYEETKDEKYLKEYAERERIYARDSNNHLTEDSSQETKQLMELYTLTKDNKEIETAREVAKRHDNNSYIIKRKDAINAFLYIYDATKDNSDLNEARKRLNIYKDFEIDPIMTKTIPNLSTMLYESSGELLDYKTSFSLINNSRKYTKNDADYCFWRLGRAAMLHNENEKKVRGLLKLVKDDWKFEFLRKIISSKYKKEKDLIEIRYLAEKLDQKEINSTYSCLNYFDSKFLEIYNVTKGESDLNLAKNNIKKAKENGKKMVGKSSSYAGLEDFSNPTEDPKKYCCEYLDILKKSAGTKEFDLLLKNNSFKQFLEAFKSDKIDVFYKEGLKTEIVWALGDHGAIDAASKIADSLINPGYRFGAYKTLVKNVYKKFPKELVN